jgi:two-component system, NarL family, capsular synthesis sensor histidine kinase RcsC
MKFRWNHALVVGNNFVHRTMLEFNLAKYGFVVTLAADANEAFHLAEKHHFGLIVADLETPHGTGIDLARQLRHMDYYDDTPMVLIAGEQADLDMAYLRDELWLFVVREPCNLAEVVEKISSFFMPQQSST